MRGLRWQWLPCLAMACVTGCASAQSNGWMPAKNVEVINAVYFSWRSFMGAKGLTPAQTALWDRAFALMVKAPE